MENTSKKKTIWSLVLKVIITVATAVAGAFGLSACGVIYRKKPERIPDLKEGCTRQTLLSFSVMKHFTSG